jgi:hypothetical protein
VEYNWNPYRNHFKFLFLKMSAAMTGDDKRFGISRRRYQYDGYLPERRSGKDRREGKLPSDFNEPLVKKNRTCPET